VLACATQAQARDLPHHHAVSEDISEQRRAVYVRVDRRVDEDDLLAIAAQVEAKGKKPFARTYVNFILPGMPVNQGAWASVLFSPEPKVLVHGLSRTDEELFLAEHRADTRSLLGSWLTSPPAAPGRLTIYSDHGKVYAEWRLRGGQKTVDELRDATLKSVRRFDVPGGGYYTLTRSGDLEIWDKTTLIATAERIRPDYLAAPAIASIRQPTPSVAPRVASARAAPSLLGAGGLGSTASPAMVSSPIQPEPLKPESIKTAPVKSAFSVVQPVVAMPQPQTYAPIPATSVAADAMAQNGRPALGLSAGDHLAPRANAKKASKAKSRQKGAAEIKTANKARDLTPGETVAAKLSGRL